MRDEINDPDEEVEEGSEWPYWSLFFLGSFGRDSTGGRRLWRWAGAALLVVMVASLGLRAPAYGVRVTCALLIPAAVVAIGWSHVEYLRALDELRRRLQLEALALSYGATMALGAAWWAFTASGLVSTNPGWLLSWLLIAEPLRGVALVYLARRYR